MGTWLDFKQLREGLDFAQVLRHYGVELKLRKGEQHAGPCPLPTHKSENKSKSFSANVKSGIFRCFSCNASGNALDFVAMMEGLNPAVGAEIRKAALIVAEKFGGGDAGNRENSKERVNRAESKKLEAQENAEQGATCPAIVNAPLDFQLKLEAEHSYLKERGFTKETIAHFGVGYCSRGSLQERIAIPLHDSQGRLIGYAGRVIDDKKISKENPKYRFPGPRNREGKRYEFQKSLFLYNGFGVGSDLSDLIVVEGFASVWWLWQHGYPHTVALMGDSCSDEQAKLIVDKVSPRGRIWILTDGDEGGELCGQSAIVRLAPHRFTRWIRLKKGEQPTDCSGNVLDSLLEFQWEEKGAYHGPA